MHRIHIAYEAQDSFAFDCVDEVNKEIAGIQESLGDDEVAVYVTGRSKDVALLVVAKTWAHVFQEGFDDLWADMLADATRFGKDGCFEHTIVNVYHNGIDPSDGVLSNGVFVPINYMSVLGMWVKRNWADVKAAANLYDNDEVCYAIDATYVRGVAKDIAEDDDSVANWLTTASDADIHSVMSEATSDLESEDMNEIVNDALYDEIKSAAKEAAAE